MREPEPWKRKEAGLPLLTPVTQFFAYTQTVVGANTFKWTGRLNLPSGIVRLKPGNYRLTARAFDSAENESAPVVRPFRILK